MWSLVEVVSVLGNHQFRTLKQQNNLYLGIPPPVCSVHFCIDSAGVLCIFLPRLILNVITVCWLLKNVFDKQNRVPIPVLGQFVFMVIPSSFLLP